MRWCCIAKVWRAAIGRRVIVPMMAVALVGASCSGGNERSRSEKRDFCTMLTELQQVLEVGPPAQEAQADPFTEMSDTAQLFADVGAEAPAEIHDDWQLLASSMMTFARGLSAMRPLVAKALASDNPDELRGIAKGVGDIVDTTFGTNAKEIKAAADRVATRARDECRVDLVAGTADAATPKAPAASTSRGGGTAPQARAVAPSPDGRVAAARLPNGFNSDGDYISGWYWLRDAPHQQSGNWVLDLPSGPGDLNVDLAVLATSRVNGPRGVDARFFLSYGPVSSTGAKTTAETRLVTLPNVSPAADPVGYTTRGTVTLPTSAFPAGTSQFWVRISRQGTVGGEAASRTDEHVAVNADSVRVTGTTTTTTATTTPPTTATSTTTTVPQTTTTRQLSGPTAVVSMGDSFISGEGGRWNGNALSPFGCRADTDRACRWEWVDVLQEVHIDVPGVGWLVKTITRWAYVPVWMPTHDASRVYGASAASGCHRSDTAEVNAAITGIDAHINLACSGGTAEDVYRAGVSSNAQCDVEANRWSTPGCGQVFKGEQPQATELVSKANENQVKLIVVSIGGNDLRFADIVTDCVYAYILSPAQSPRRCSTPSAGYDDWPAFVNAKLDLNDHTSDTVANRVRKTIDEIRAAMETPQGQGGAGYSPDQYRILLQSYPSPIPRASEMAYPESLALPFDVPSSVLGVLGLSLSNGRITLGCPFWNVDATWARDTLVPRLSDTLEAVAIEKRVAFLDLRDFLQTREVCSTSTTMNLVWGPPSETSAEWARSVYTGFVQGEKQESIHPNAYAQQGLQRCLTGAYNYIWSQSRPLVRLQCLNSPGQGVNGVYVTPKAGSP